jgi:hypothetical protein
MESLSQTIYEVLNDDRAPLIAIITGVVIEVALTPLLLQVLPGVHAVNTLWALFAGVVFAVVTSISFFVAFMFWRELPIDFGRYQPFIWTPLIAPIANAFMVAALVGVGGLTTPAGFFSLSCLGAVLAITVFSFLATWSIYGLLMLYAIFEDWRLWRDKK